VKGFFHRLGIVLALSASLAYTLHLKHDGGNLPQDASHHCCLCHTIGITAVSTPPSSQPPVFVSYRVTIVPEVPSEAALFHIDSPRGPPAA
jgi:hypothetical protein